MYFMLLNSSLKLTPHLLKTELSGFVYIERHTNSNLFTNSVDSWNSLNSVPELRQIGNIF